MTPLPAPRLPDTYATSFNMCTYLNGPNFLTALLSAYEKTVTTNTCDKITNFALLGGLLKVSFSKLKLEFQQKIKNP